MTAGQRAVKRTLDLLLATALLLVFAPLMLALAVAVRLDSPGGAVFSQLRVGRDGRTFRMYKLRSMRVDADDAQHVDYVRRLIHGEAVAQDGMFKLTCDPRVTRVGRILRRYSLDELPQLWNVVRGDMSLVGPRPALPREVELYDQQAMTRLAVKPGLTGLWQVSGRCELNFAQMIELDRSYWQEWSLRLELSILARTPLVALTARGAA
jgi:lipopolysaccharide/colanic/teichoic acid biosynthesis glycosyltransferase